MRPYFSTNNVASKFGTCMFWIQWQARSASLRCLTATEQPALHLLAHKHLVGGGGLIPARLSSSIIFPMSLKEKISADLKEAMKVRDQVLIDTLRSAVSALTYKSTETGKDLIQEDELTVIQKAG